MIGRTIPTGLYGITFPDDGNDLTESVRMMIDDGAGMVQYRDKSADDRLFLSRAGKLKRVCEDNGAVFVVNDRIGVAEALDTNVHFGPDGELPVTLRNRDFGNIIGYSIDCYGCFEEVRRSGILDHVDYLGVGPVFFTGLKPKPPTGLTVLGRIAEESLIPVYAVGGMDENNIEKVLSMNPDGVAVMSYKFRNRDLIRKINAHYRI